MIGAANLIGAQLGNYTIQALIGSGGMASVYRGFDQNLRRPIAIKVLSDTAAAEPGVAERFRQEARLIASLRHPNIVQVYDFGEQDGHTYMVQELLPGPTLQQRLRDLAARGERPARQEVLAIVGQLASALDAAHAMGIIHRDVKPGNAIWNGGGALVLTDFGIAKNTMLPGGHTQTGFVIGTPDYLSPEQAQGLRVTPSSDIYALGVVLYELLAGRLPFSGPTPLGVAMSHIQDTPPPLRQLRPDLPPAIEAVIQQALAKDPAARFRTAAALAQAIERAWPATAAIPGAAGLHNQPTRAWEGAAARPAPAPDQSLAHARPARRAHAALPAPPRPRRSGVSPLLAGVLLAALVIGGIVLLGREAGQLAAPAPTAPAIEATPAPEQPTPVPAAQAPAAPEPTVAEPTPAPQPTAPPPAPEPTAAEPTPAPQPTTAPAAPAGPIDELHALLEAGKADGRSGKDGGAMLADLDRARQALADGNEKRATDRLRDLQKRLVEGVKDQQVGSSFAQQALAGITAVADTYGLKLAPIKDKGGDDNQD